MNSVKVTFDYAATQPDELDLKVGEIVTGVDTGVEGGWWEGVHPSGKKGWFPDNFVEKIEQKKAKAKPPPPVAAPAKAPPPAKVPPPAKAPPPSTSGKFCKCTYGYDAQNEDELTLTIGDIIAITKQEEEGWWEGTLNGKTGVFPNNFVEELPAGAAPPPSVNIVEAPAEDETAKPKKVEKVGFGNIFAGGGVPQLRKTGTFSGGSKPEFLAKKRAAGPGDAVQPKKPAVDVSKLDIVKVEFDYGAQNDDELHLNKGDFVLVSKREDGGWWEGKLVGTSKSGVFPDNFVVPASQSEKEAQAALIAPRDDSAPPRPAGNKPAEAIKPPPAPAADPAPPPAAKKPPPVSMKKRPPAVSMKKPPPSTARKPPPPAAEPVAIQPPKPSSQVKPPAPVPTPVASATTPAAPDPAVAKAAEAAKKAADEAIAMVQALKTEMSALTKQNETFKKQIKMLTGDLDEERAARATMRVEIDRLKKLADI